MNTAILRRAMLLAAAASALAGSAAAQTTGGIRVELAKVMDKYAAALDANDVEALVGLYSPNGVFMREDMRAVIGSEALRAAYKVVVATLKVSLKFDVQEAEESGDMAWLRSLSSGRVKVLKTGAETPESFNQMVVFRKEAGAWKIRSYLYASNKPETGQTPK
jgi:uncharacterized protein (TIGR02246 family)